MSLKKFMGKTSREAMISARQILGDDAVIVSTRKTAHGVEVLASLPQALADMAEPMLEEQAPLLRSARRTANAPEAPVPFLKFIQEQPKVVSVNNAATAPVFPFHTAPTRAAPTLEHTLNATANPALNGLAPASLTSASFTSHLASGAAPEVTQQLQQELSSLRAWMSSQFDTLAYHDTLRHHPVSATLQKDLLVAGFSPRLVREVTRHLPADADTTGARTWAAHLLEKSLLVAAPEQNLVDAGGIYALVGPTGVGKTTTVAKLASHCAVKYGRDAVGLITIDSYRIGAQDQLRIYGKILGISVHTAQDRESLLSVLRSLTSKKLVLIDTVGLGQRDERVSELLTTVGASAIKRLLVLNSAAQAETLEDVMRCYRSATHPPTTHQTSAHQATVPPVLTGLILSKTDEAVRLGTGLDIAVRHRVPLYYETHGQRVPEDIAVADAKSLILRATRYMPAQAFQVDNEDVGLTFLARQAQRGVSAHA